MESLFCVLSVQNDIVPPTINFTEGDEDPEIDYKLNLTFNKAQNVRYVQHFPILSGLEDIMHV